MVLLQLVLQFGLWRQAYLFLVHPELANNPAASILEFEGGSTHGFELSSFVAFCIVCIRDFAQQCRRRLWERMLPPQAMLNFVLYCSTVRSSINLFEGSLIVRKERRASDAFVLGGQNVGNRCFIVGLIGPGLAVRYPKNVCFSRKPQKIP